MKKSVVMSGDVGNGCAGNAGAQICKSVGRGKPDAGMERFYGRPDVYQCL